MENAVEALKIAGAVLMFILALTLSISSLSQANSSVSNIATMYDREAQYEYVQPSKELTREVKVETIIPTMYKAYEENMGVYFYDKNGNPLPIYYKTNQDGKWVDEQGNTTNSEAKVQKVNYIDSAKEGYETLQQQIDHLSMILAGTSWNDDGAEEMIKKYNKQFIYKNGFYEYLKRSYFYRKFRRI